MLCDEVRQRRTPVWADWRTVSPHRHHLSHRRRQNLEKSRSAEESKRRLRGDLDCETPFPLSRRVCCHPYHEPSRSAKTSTYRSGSGGRLPESFRTRAYFRPGRRVLDFSPLKKFGRKTAISLRRNGLHVAKRLMSLQSLEIRSSFTDRTLSELRAGT
jgi:hypothetical protein